MPVLGCSPNTAIAYYFLVGKGLSSFQAAGVVGNLQWESHLNPKLQALDSDNLTHRGIAMWSPTRWANLLSFAGTRDPWDLNTQLDFLWQELPTNGLDQLLEATTIEDATLVFQKRFENPKASKAHTDERIKAARFTLDCVSVRPPETQGNGRKWLGLAGVAAFVVAGSYGVYKALSAVFPEAVPVRRVRPPPVFRPVYRPVYRPDWEDI